MEGQDLVAIIVAALLRQIVEEVLLAHEMYHIGIKAVESRVLEQFVVGEVPLAAGILARPAVALAGKIDSFRMAELVAHKVEIATGTECQRHQADHLVQGDAPVHCHIRREHRH